MGRSSPSLPGTLGQGSRYCSAPDTLRAALSLEHGLPDNLNVVGKPYQRDELAKKLRLAIGG